MGTGTIKIESNGDQLQLAFPNLITASNITFRDIPSISVPSLTNTSGSLGFYESSFETLNLPNLTEVGGTLAINTNSRLNNITAPVLERVTGGVQVQNNTVLEEITFPALTTVTGATDMYGNFTSVSLPALKDNRGAFNLQSTADISSSCNVFDDMHGPSDVIKGKYQCRGSLTNPGNGSSSSGAANHMGFTPAALGLSGVLAAMLSL